MTNTTSPAMIATAERRNFVMKCRKRGATYVQIAELAVRKFGTAGLPKHWDGRSVYKDVKREIEKLQADTTETADEVRQIALQRLDAMHTGLWTKATKGNTAAIDRVLKIMERRAKLLGIDAPTKIDSFGKNIDLSMLSDAQINRLAQGEELLSVLANPGAGGAGEPTPEA